jgi:hypothetical protein
MNCASWSVCRTHSDPDLWELHDRVWHDGPLRRLARDHGFRGPTTARRNPAYPKFLKDLAVALDNRRAVS